MQKWILKLKLIWFIFLKRPSCIGNAAVTKDINHLIITIILSLSVDFMCDGISVKYSIDDIRQFGFT